MAPRWAYDEALLDLAAFAGLYACAWFFIRWFDDLELEQPAVCNRYSGSSFDSGQAPSDPQPEAVSVERPG